MKNERTEHASDAILHRDTALALPAAIIIFGVLVAGAIYYGPGNTAALGSSLSTAPLPEEVLPTSGVVLPVSWGDLGVQLVAAGVIDAPAFRALYEERGVFTEEYEKLLSGRSIGKLTITRENAGYLLNLLWALGLANKNPILETGEMVDSRYGAAGNFASTGGWTISKGDSMEHYSHHALLTLSSKEQALIDRMSRGIYRSCCGNSTHFPDCNHGMAMLGLLELMASQGVSEKDMWKAALAVNSFWFPDTYFTIATYMKDKGILWKDVNPQEVLGAEYSSAQGYAAIAAQVETKGSRSGGGCGV